MATNLWTDMEALDRLARSARAAEHGDEGRLGAPARRSPLEARPLLPRARGAGFEIASCERPARFVSGDLLDAFPLGDGAVAVVVGDVSGKGIPAGVLGAFARSIVRHVAPLGADPGDTLQRVNRILCGARLDAMYVTLFLGILDTATGLFRYANGGHPPALRLLSGGSALPFGEATGPILGLLDRRSFETGAVTLRRGELVVVTTDGVTEAEREDGESFGLPRLAALLERLERRSPAAACAAIEAAIEAFEGDRRHDDATILALRFTGAAARPV
jgi:sigma-B regulation protein RsbU (phosphoserine phosphatase)